MQRASKRDQTRRPRTQPHTAGAGETDALPEETGSLLNPSLRLASILENSDDAIITATPEGIIAGWNSAAERIYGYRAQEAIGQSLDLLVPSDKREQLQGIWQRIRGGERIPHYETVRLRKDGTRVEVSLTVCPIKDGAGEVLGVTSIGRDITERKKAEQSILESERSFRAVFTGSAIGMALIDQEGHTVESNPALRQMLGYSAEELRQMTFPQFTHPEDITPNLHLFREVLAGSRGFYQIEKRYLRKNGDVMWGRVTVSLLPGSKALAIGMVEDITGRKLAEHQLQEAQQKLVGHANELEARVAERTARLEQSLASLEGVLYHVAHDLRAPLRAIHSFTNLLKSKYADRLDKVDDDYADRIVRASRRMDALILGLLEYGRLGHKKMTFTSVDLNALTEQAVQSLAAQIRVQGAEVRVDKPLPRVWGDGQTIHQLLLVLLDNALKFVPAGRAPRVRIWAEPREQMVRLMLRDNGIGIDPRYHGKIFGVFERLHDTEAYPGTGIGLAIARKGVGRMGGEIGVDSQSGDGSLFWVDLKAASQ